MLVIGLTGPMGAGKSAVLGWLGELGAVCLRADDASRELLSTDVRLLSSVREQLGDSVFRADGSLDRAKTAALIFEDARARERLESALHGPMVRWLAEHIEALRQDPCPPPAVAIEAAILTHMGGRGLADVVVRVSAPLEQCLARIQARDGISPQEARARLALHQRLGLFTEPADYVIDTSGTPQQAHAATVALWNQLLPDGRSAVHEG